jgi:hypothetical protein
MFSSEDLVRRFNEDEAVWRRYQERRQKRRGRFRLRSRIGEKFLDQLDWLVAERETRPARAIGEWIDP